MGFIKRDALRWPNGVMPIQRNNIFDPYNKDHRHPDAIASLDEAVKEYAKKTAISFVKRDARHSSYVTVEWDVFGSNSSRRWGFVLPHLPMIPLSPIPDIPFPLMAPVFPAYGRQGGEQFLWMAMGAHESKYEPEPGQVGTCLHEIGHALGLYHEHQRRDRRDYASVKSPYNERGINYTFNYEIFKGQNDFQVGDYDCRSIMNYTGRILAADPNTCGKETKGKKDKKGRPISFYFRWNEYGGEDGDGDWQKTLSDGDVEAVSFLYPVKTWATEFWSTGWMATKPFQTQASDPLVLWYQPSNGAVVISSLLPGDEKVLLSSSWGKGISVVASYEAQGKSYVLSFNSSTDMLNIFEVASSVNGPQLIKRTSTELAKLSPSHIEPFLIHGYPHLLVYSNKTGAAGILGVSNGGKSVHTEWTSPVAWDKDWTHFSIYSHTAKTPRLLAYKASTGRISYTNIEYQSIEITWDNSVAIRFSQKKNPFVNFASYGGENPLPVKGNYSKKEWLRNKMSIQNLGDRPNNPGWGSFFTYTHRGKHYLFLMKDKRGHAWLQFWRLTDSKINPWILIGEMNWSPRWDTFIPYVSRDSSKKEDLLFVAYKSGMGNAAFGKIFAESRRG